jgi:hypothetical protein
MHHVKIYSDFILLELPEHPFELGGIYMSSHERLHPTSINLGFGRVSSKIESGFSRISCLDFLKL